MTTTQTGTQLSDTLATVRLQTGRVFRRSRSDRMLSGVCGGAAEKLGIDANIVRLGVALLTVLGFGAVAVLYVVAWIAAPEADVAPVVPVTADVPFADPAYVPGTDTTVR